MLQEFSFNHVLEQWKNSIGQIVRWKALHDKQTVFWIITNTSQELILKKVSHLTDSARLLSEYRVLEYLHRHDVPVSIPILTDNQNVYAEFEDEIFTLSPYISEPSYDEKISDQIRHVAIGKALGKFHKVLATYPHERLSWTMNLYVLRWILNHRQDIMTQCIQTNNTQ